MAKKTKVGKLLGMIVGLIVAIGIGGLFVNGTFLTVWGLSVLPQIVHTIVGWAIVIMAILGFVFDLMGR